jgi:peptidoglycan hydrolase CwlO-like protein
VILRSFSYVSQLRAVKSILANQESAYMQAKEEEKRKKKEAEKQRKQAEKERKAQEAEAKRRAAAEGEARRRAEAKKERVSASTNSEPHDHVDWSGSWREH